VRLAPDLPLGWIDPEQFRRVVINLVDNAAEALRDAWVREIEVSTGPGPAPDLIELAVSDSGPGISPEDKERLFLPYFSTKNRGTGLGLAIVSRIVSEHGGAIRVEDNRPSGSRFLIETPAAEPVTGGVLAPLGART
jgi:signal transduction histidine kinase